MQQQQSSTWELTNSFLDESKRNSLDLLLNQIDTLITNNLQLFNLINNYFSQIYSELRQQIHIDMGDSYCFLIIIIKMIALSASLNLIITCDWLTTSLRTCFVQIFSRLTFDLISELVFWIACFNCVKTLPVVKDEHFNNQIQRKNSTTTFQCRRSPLLLLDLLVTLYYKRAVGGLTVASARQ